jgi:chaperonin GroEL (HSP60 family)
LTQAILIEGCKSIAAGVNVMDLRNGINKAVDAVIKDLKSRAVMISTPEEITQVQGIFKKTFMLLNEFWLRKLIYNTMLVYFPSITNFRSILYRH